MTVVADWAAVLGAKGSAGTDVAYLLEAAQRCATGQLSITNGSAIQQRSSSGKADGHQLSVVGAPLAAAADIQAALPLCSYLAESQTALENATPVTTRLCAVLDALTREATASSAQQSGAAPQSVPAHSQLLAQLFNGLGSVLQSATLPQDAKQQLSRAAQSLLHAAFEGSSSSGGSGGGAADQLGAAVRRATLQTSSVPLLAEDAAALLQGVVKQLPGATAAALPQGIPITELVALLAALVALGETQSRDTSAAIASFCCRSLIGALQPILGTAATSDSVPAPASPSLPSPAFVAAAAQLACNTTIGREGASDVSDGAAYQIAAGKLADSLLYFADGCLAFCWELGPAAVAAEEVLRIVLALLRPAARVVEQYVAAAGDVGLEVATQSRAVMVAAARLAEGDALRRLDTDGNDGMAAAAPDSSWLWDFGESGFSSSPAIQRLPVAVQVFRALAAAWHAGSQTLVKAAFLPVSEWTDPMSGDLGTSSTEHEASLVGIARLSYMLGNDDTYLRLTLPLFSDAMAEAARTASPLILALGVAGLASYGVSAARGNHEWAFTRVADSLAKLYKEPLGAARPLMHALGEEGPCTGALALAWQRLAVGLQGSKYLRERLRLRLLALFCNFALLAPTPAALRDLGALLPAIADASEGLQPQSSCLARNGSLGGAAAVTAAAQDASLVKLYLVMWTYIAVCDFTGANASRRGGAHYPSPPQWRAVMGRLARDSPALAAATGVGDETGAREVLQAELGERLARLGSRGTGPGLAANLLGSLDPFQKGLALSAASPPQTAHLLAVATMHMSSAGAQPLPPNGLPAQITRVLAEIQLMPAASSSLPVLLSTARASFATYCGRLHAAELVATAATPDTAVACQEGLAAALLDVLAMHGDHDTVASLSNDFLRQLLVSFPALLWSPAVAAALDAALEVEDERLFGDDHRNGGADEAHVYRWAERMVRMGASRAPGFTEALLHERVWRSSSSSALQHHSLALLTACLAGSGSTGRADSSSGRGVSYGLPTGMRALGRKAHYMGLVEGLATAGAAPNQQISKRQSELLARLGGLMAQQDVASQAFQDTYLTLAAVVASAPEAAPQLLQALAWAPAGQLAAETARLAAYAWTWVLTAAGPDKKVALLAHICDAWLSTADAHIGLFYDAFDPEAFQQTRGGDIEAMPAVGGGQTGEGLEGEERRNVNVVRGIAGHRAWLSFLLEVWQVFGPCHSQHASAVAAVLEQLLGRSLAGPAVLTLHPAAAGTRFRLLLLALQYVRQQVAQAGGQASLPMQLLHQRVLKAALAWFSAGPGWYGRWSRQQARDEAAAVADFLAELDRRPFPAASNAAGSGAPGSSPAHPVWGAARASAAARDGLLKLLLQAEVERLRTWADPLGPPPGRADPTPGGNLSPQQWGTLTRTAWDTDPRIALALLHRFPKVEAVRGELESLVATHASDPAIQALPAAAPLLAAVAAGRQAQAEALAFWAPCPLLEALALLSGASGRHPAVRAYALRSLVACDPQQVAFFLAQLVQQLRADAGGQVRGFLLASAQRSVLFAHHLTCALKTEGTPPEDAMNPAVKRSGWAPPKDTGLWRLTDELAAQLWRVLSPSAAEYLKAELDFFGQVTSVSGQLYPVPKDQRRAAAVKLVRQVRLPRPDLYLPTNPESRVVAVIPESATPMQSAAKVPILVAFKVEQSGPDQRKVLRPQACMFKVGDDCRQDVLALQVIALLKDAFDKAGLPLKLVPYGVLPTEYECGVIEVVPNTKSRSGLGELYDGGLFDIFVREFGAAGSPAFEAARQNFICSEAGYALACFLLQIKDRHNGNILIDGEGHIVHIDFGFMLETSPGGNLGFESAAFKLSHEMTQLMDPSGKQDSPHFRQFEELCVRGYLAARSVAEGVVATVELMAESGLPCFSRGRPVANLAARFHLELPEAQAAAFMRRTVRDAYDKWTTGLYDYVQYVQQKIPK